MDNKKAHSNAISQFVKELELMNANTCTCLQLNDYINDVITYILKHNLDENINDTPSKQLADILSNYFGSKVRFTTKSVKAKNAFRIVKNDSITVLERLLSIIDHKI